MKTILNLLILGCSLAVAAHGSSEPQSIAGGSEAVLLGYAPNSDKTYSRNEIFQQVLEALKKSPMRIPSPIELTEEEVTGLFIYDLYDPANNTVLETKSGKLKNSPCINFIEGHIYHFAALLFPYSISHIAVLHQGTVKIFDAVNCGDGITRLNEVLRYLENNGLANKSSNDVLIRLKNYRHYGWYWTVDELTVENCTDFKDDSDPQRLDHTNILYQMSEILNKESPYRQGASSLFSVYDEQAIGFFIWNLTEPSNKQTSLLERIEFKKGHVYHFAYIDAPYSFSNIAFLQNEKLKIFKLINCKGKGDKLDKVIRYLTKELRSDSQKFTILNRVKNYRDYGVYASLNGVSTPQCNQAN